MRRVVPLPWHPLSQTRVDIVALYLGADRVQIDACLRAGARGLILDALGSGNANPTIVEAVRDCVSAHVPAAVTTRVPGGRSVLFTVAATTWLAQELLFRPTFERGRRACYLRPCCPTRASQTWKRSSNDERVSVDLRCRSGSATRQHTGIRLAVFRNFLQQRFLNCVGADSGALSRGHRAWEAA